MRVGALILIIISLLSSCEHASDIIKSYGAETTVERKIGSFNELEVGEKFDIELVQDSALEGTLYLTAGKNVINGFTTKVENGILKIKNDNKFNWVRNLKVRQKIVLYYSNINKIQIYGAAKIWNNDTMKLNDLIILHAGTEDINLNIKIGNLNFSGSEVGGGIFTGTAYLFSASVDNLSYVNSTQLINDDTYLTSFSRRDSYVKARKKLMLDLYGYGNIYYKLNPIDWLKTNDLGKGEIIYNP